MCALLMRPLISRYSIFLAVHGKLYQLHSYRALRTLMELPHLAEWNSSVQSFSRVGWPFYCHVNGCASSGRICYYVISLAFYKIFLKFSFKCSFSACQLFHVRWLKMHKKFVLIPYVDRSTLWACTKTSYVLCPFLKSCRNDIDSLLWVTECLHVFLLKYLVLFPCAQYTLHIFL